MKNATSETYTEPKKAQTNPENMKTSSYRGFTSIDQEMGKEIAMQFFYPSKKKSFEETGSLIGK